MTREEAISVIQEVFDNAELSHCGHYATALDMAIEALQAEYEDYEHATLVDIKEPLKVLVVRCKDCRHYAKGHCYMYGGQMNDDDYCSRVERREE